MRYRTLKPFWLKWRKSQRGVAAQSNKKGPERSAPAQKSSTPPSAAAATNPPRSDEVPEGWQLKKKPKKQKQEKKDKAATDAGQEEATPSPTMRIAPQGWNVAPIEKSRLPHAVSGVALVSGLAEAADLVAKHAHATVPLAILCEGNVVNGDRSRPFWVPLLDASSRTSLNNSFYASWALPARK